MHARKSLKSLSFPKINPGRKQWIIGSDDGAEICMLIGLYVLFVLEKVYGVQNVGLYWDDGLACLHQISGPAWKNMENMERCHQGFLGKFRLENNHHNKFKNC